VSQENRMSICKACVEIYAHEDDASEPISVYLQTDDDGEMKVYKLSSESAELMTRRVSHSFEVPFHQLKELEKQVCNWDLYNLNTGGAK
jgi:hypothetical protein